MCLHAADVKNVHVRIPSLTVSSGKQVQVGQLLLHRCSMSK